MIMIRIINIVSIKLYCFVGFPTHLQSKTILSVDLLK